MAPPTVLIIGCGPVGLVNARTLLDDGFAVTVIAKEHSPGGNWATTYPDLATNSPWGAFTFSGLDMPLPDGLNGMTVPAKVYRAYLEEFYDLFVRDRATVGFDTAITSLTPTPGAARGWTATLLKDEQEIQDSFDRVLIATGPLGNPFIPPVLQVGKVPVYHSADLSDPVRLRSLLSTVQESKEDPKVDGDERTIIVVGSGKSGMDAAAVLANQGRKVVMTYRGPLGWLAPAVRPGSMGANRLQVMFGPTPTLDCWTMWFYHCTWLGAKWIKQFWTVCRGIWSSAYHAPLFPPPPSDPFTALPYFAGGITSEPTDFISHLKSGRIALLPQATPSGVIVSSEGGKVTYDTPEGTRTVRCGAIVAATGYSGDILSFIDKDIRSKLGLMRMPPLEGWQGRVKKMRGKWLTVPHPEEEVPLDQPNVWRGALPAGRWRERDLAIVGGTHSFYMPALSYEIESHWVSSLFSGDPNLRLPSSEQEMIKVTRDANEFIMARFPGIKPLLRAPGGTYYVGWNDMYHSRELLRDMRLEPWRQKSKAPWWRFWSADWLDIRFAPEQYATIWEERRRRWRPDF